MEKSDEKAGMTTDNRSRQELLAEIDELRVRLEEAEETLSAIQSGEVDALVVSRPEGERIFTLQGAEHPYRMLVETMNEGAVTLSEDGTIIFCNRRLSEMLEIPLEKLVGYPLMPHVAESDHPLFLKCTRKWSKEEISLVTGAGTQVPVLVSCRAVDFSGSRGISAVLTDITARKAAEDKILRLNLLYTVLSGTDNAIVRATDRDSMFQEICRIAVEHGGFKMAWIGLANSESGLVTPVAWNGTNRSFLHNLKIRIGDVPNEEVVSPTGPAFREGALKIVGDVLEDPGCLTWREEASKRGFRSSAAIPLKLSGSPVGVLTLYSGEKEFFNSYFADLLLQMGSDISFALDKFNLVERHQEADKALQDGMLERLQIKESSPREGEAARTAKPPGSHGRDDQQYRAPMAAAVEQSGTHGPAVADVLRTGRIYRRFLEGHGRQGHGDHSAHVPYHR